MIDELKALIIDDSLAFRMTTKRLLEVHGFKLIETADDGKLGVAKAKTLRPHIVYLDGIMPTMDGMTALREIKLDNPDTVVIIASSLSEKAKVLEFKEAGADLYMRKPYDKKLFDEITQKAIAIVGNRKKATV